MPVTVEFSRDLTETTGAERIFEGFAHLRDYLRSVHLAPVYRMRVHYDELGHMTARELLAVADDGQEFYLGNVTAIGGAE